jgi:hypothetical protein
LWGPPDEYCIFLKNLTETELAQITSLDGAPLDVREELRQFLTGKDNPMALQDKKIMPPPWMAFPEIERYSIGWRMGYGEDYIDRFDDWSTAWQK